MKKACFLFIAMMFLSTNAMAKEPPQWFYEAIKKENPNQLAYFLGVDKDCPLTEEALTEIVDGVFIRSRIKPLKEGVFGSARIYLDLTVKCIPLKSNISGYVIDVYFARWRPRPPILINENFGSEGRGPNHFIQQQFKEVVENAITAYIKANFNF